MPKLITTRGYYAPIKFIKKVHANENLINKKELIEYLCKAYRHAIRKILLEYPASFAENSPIYDLCVEHILTSDDISKVTVQWIEERINKNKELVTLKNSLQDDPNGKKLRLIKRITKAHQNNLAFDEHVVTFVNSALEFEHILNREYKNGFSIFSATSDLHTKEAIMTLKKALNGKSVNLLSHIPALRRGQLGDTIRNFVKQGHADELLDGKTVRTIDEFITALHQQVNPNPSQTNRTTNYSSLTG